MSPIWELTVGIIAQKAMVNMDWLPSTVSCQYLCNG